MITNERQYKITKSQLKRFEEGIAAHAEREPSPDVDPRIHAAMGEALKSQADELGQELRDYEKLRSGRVKERKLDSLRELPVALIEARIAAHVTQKDLGKRIDVAAQQVQRWEASEYSGVSFERLQDVADALEVQITEKVTFPAASKRGGGTVKLGSSGPKRVSAGKNRPSARRARPAKTARRAT